MKLSDFTDNEPELEPYKKEKMNESQLEIKDIVGEMQDLLTKLSDDRETAVRALADIALYRNIHDVDDSEPSHEAKIAQTALKELGLWQPNIIRA